MSASATAPLLEVPALCAQADGASRPLLDQVALTVAPGTVVAVVGPSGSGKTTLGLAVLGAARPSVSLTGRVLLDGTDLLGLGPHARRSARAGDVAHLPQHPESVLDPVRRVGPVLTELAALGHAGRTARRAASARALSAVDLAWDATHRRFPHQLSGGQQQRLALASALVTGARLLVLDEPTSGLDPVLARALGRTVRRLADEGAGILLLSHDLPLVRGTADRVIVLDHGRAVDEGPTSDILATAPSGKAPHAATRALLAAERRTGARRGPASRARSPLAAPSRGVVAQDIVVRRSSGTLLGGPVSMAFPPGSSTALLGPSGSGKTTFARVLAGLTTPTSGEIRVDGSPLPARIDRRDTAQRRVVQYVHQSSQDSFERHRPLLDQLGDTGRLLRGLSQEEATAEIRGTAEALGLEPALLDRTPGHLSGGQLQRCALLRAIAARPVLLVCDEVTSALDTASRERVLDALPGLLAPCATALLFISHDLGAVRATAEEFVLFETGGGIRRGRTDAVTATDTGYAW